MPLPPSRCQAEAPFACMQTSHLLNHQPICSAVCPAICPPQPSLLLRHTVVSWASHGPMLKERDCIIFYIKRERHFCISTATCSRARRLTGTSSCQALTGCRVNAAYTCSYVCWPQNDKTLLPSKQHLCYQVPPTYSC